MSNDPNRRAARKAMTIRQRAEAVGILPRYLAMSEWSPRSERYKHKTRGRK